MAAREESEHSVACGQAIKIVLEWGDYVTKKLAERRTKQAGTDGSDKAYRGLGAVQLQAVLDRPPWTCAHYGLSLLGCHEAESATGCAQARGKVGYSPRWRMFTCPPTLQSPAPSVPSEETLRTYGSERQRQ